MWRADCDPAVVTVEASRTSPDDPNAFDVTHFVCPVLVLRSKAGVEHLLIGDGTCQVRLDVRQGTLLDGPIRLRYDLAGCAGVEAKLLTLRRLLALTRLHRLPRGLVPSNRRARRWMMALRAWDARMAGASHREIAVVLFGQATVDTDWNGPSAYLRCRVQRLVRLGEILVRGSYRLLLR
jgi:hypothetical protein